MRKNLKVYKRENKIKMKRSNHTRGKAVTAGTRKDTALNDRKRILIVEDAEALAFYLHCILKTYGETEIACNGREALAKLALSSYDLIISDINMPVMDGREFYKAAAESCPDIKSRFLFFTSSTERHHLDFFNENNIPMLRRRSPIEEIKIAAGRVLSKSYAGRSQAGGGEESKVIGDMSSY
jgi:CheY-like chemotaxis protein